MRKVAVVLGVVLLVGLVAWQQSRIAEVERDLAQTERDIDQLEGDGQAQDTASRLDSLAMDLEQLEERLLDVETTTSEDGDRIERLALYAGDLDSDLDSLAGEVDSLDGRTQAAEAGVIDLQAAIDRLIEFVVLG